jgi:predicted metal-dependent phosphoesterase TrpH
LKAKLADLHIHTIYSDGTFTPTQVVEHAAKEQLYCIAISDHDSVKGLDEAIHAGENHGVEVIPAVEISAEEDEKELHILGFYINYNEKGLLSLLKQIREDRKERLYKMAEVLKKHGIDIDADDVIKFTGDVSISRLHIAQYMKTKGLVSSWREAFNKYIGDDKPCYIASFRYSAKQAIDLIKSAKGIPVIAHPGLNRVDGLLPKLIEYGIEGIEAYHTDHNAGVSKYYEKYAKEHNLLITGGSDCHGMAKGKILMGKITVPYAYVEALKSARS